LILEILPELQTSLASLERIYVKSPLTGAAVPLSALVDTDSNATGPLSVNGRGGGRDYQGRERHWHAELPLVTKRSITSGLWVIRDADFSGINPSAPAAWLNANASLKVLSESSGSACT
jgi:hypothetical protein